MTQGKISIGPAFEFRVLQLIHHDRNGRLKAHEAVTFVALAQDRIQGLITRRALCKAK